MFSRRRSSRERKELTIHPRRCRSDTIMARILSALSEFSFAPSHSFCRCTTFWRGTGKEKKKPKNDVCSAANPQSICGVSMANY